MATESIIEGLGLVPGWKYEAIVTTYSGDKPHAAPIGFRVIDARTVWLEIYKTSSTAKNIENMKSFAVNCTGDVSLFYRSLYKKGPLEYGLEERTTFPVLKDAEAWIEARLVDRQDLGPMVRYVAAATAFYKRKKDAVIINRADSLALECMIKASKIPYLPKTEKEFLIKEIENMLQAITRIAPGSHAEEMAKDIASNLRR
jgi:hypothetical protein